MFGKYNTDTFFQKSSFYKNIFIILKDYDNKTIICLWIYEQFSNPLKFQAFIERS